MEEEMTYEEHLQWAKDRAAQHAKPADAYASFVSDMSKHPELADHPCIQLGMQLLMIGELDQKFIEGFR